MIRKIVSALGIGGVLGALAPAAFAQTPTPFVMDTTVNASATNLLQSLVNTVLTQIPAAIAIVGGLMVTLFGLNWLIGFARAHMHG